MPINELPDVAQGWTQLRKQDPEAPIRNHPGSELRRLGAVGIGASRNKPTVTKADLDRFFAAHDGAIVETPRGARYALVTAPQGPELWHLRDDDEEIVDVGRGSYSDDGKRPDLVVRKAERGWVVPGWGGLAAAADRSTPCRAPADGLDRRRGRGFVPGSGGRCVSGREAR